MITVLQHALMITGFVFVMMVVIEYLNVLTQGSWQQKLTRNVWGQYLLASFLGATPGCLGAFAVVAMYSHGVVTVGAAVAAMIATSGDESFVMLALIPKDALWLFAALFALGIVTGALADALLGRRRPVTVPCAQPLEVHADTACRCFPREMIVQQWRECSPARGILAGVLLIFVLALTFGWVGPATWSWIRVTALALSAVALFIACTVPDHFLHEHLWEHAARKHVPRIFLWTLGALAAMYLLVERLDLEAMIWQGRWIVLLAACVVGLIPESGPHLVFVTLYAQGSLPLSILLANSIVQDGHGMLPLLAHSRRAFMVVKAINFIVGLAVGAIALALGF